MDNSRDIKSFSAYFYSLILIYCPFLGLGNSELFHFRLWRFVSLTRKPHLINNIIFKDRIIPIILLKYLSEFIFYHLLLADGICRRQFGTDLFHVQIFAHYEFDLHSVNFFYPPYSQPTITNHHFSRFFIFG
jgi:hypothetical protein